MKISELFREYDFYDSLVEGIIYHKNTNLVMLEIELCNWKQTYYAKTDPEMITGRIVFTNISKFDLTPNIMEFDGDEILEFSIVTFEEEEIETLKLILLGDGDVKILEIIGANAVWEN